jgi:hypothetical protein
MTVNEHQFGEMKRRLSEEGGFTYDPRKQEFATKGYSVAAHPAAELRIPQERTSPEALAGYVAGSAPTWTGTKKKGGAGQEMIGGWRSEHHDVLDLPKVYPATAEGHTKSRRAQILRTQEASYALHTGAEDVNPWHPSHLSAQLPEYAGLLRNRPEKALEQPEVQAWTEGPMRRAQWDREKRQQGRAPRRRT